MSPGKDIRNFLQVIFCLACLILTAAPSAAQDKDYYRPDPEKKESSIVPQSESISDEQARLMLAELLLQKKDPDRLNRAEDVIGALVAHRPDSSRVKLLRIHLEYLRENRGSAIDLAENFFASAGFDPDAFLRLADLFADFGRYDRCRDVFRKILRKTDGDTKKNARLAFADRSMRWGNFHLGETILREHLEKNPGNKELHLQLARNLNAQQRYDEARKHLLLVTGKKDAQSHGLSQACDSGTCPEIYDEAWAERVTTGLQEGDYAAAARITDVFVDTYGPKDVILIPGARSYYLANRPDEAEALYKKAVDAPRRKAAALTGLGRIKAEQGKNEEAADYWERALAVEPDAALPKILLLDAADKSLPDYVERVIQDEPGPGRLSDLGAALAMQGLRGLAASCYETAYEKYPDHFPSGMGLAETYGAAGRYQESLAVLSVLLDDYPESDKLALTRARVLAWSGNYRESVDAYETLHQKNPENPVVLKEAARAAYWGKMADTGDDYYLRIYTPAVDELLLERIRAKVPAADDPLLQHASETLAREIESRSVYTGYETFFSWYEKEGHRLREIQRERIEDAREELDYRYRIQKKTFLERQSKNLAYHRRFAPAGRRLEELTALDPGNQEALFEQAQVACALGLCDRERKYYEQLLTIDPLHGQAATALERQKIRARPRVLGGYSLWREKGRGDLARMARHRGDLGIEVPVDCRHRLTLVAQRYFESPLKYGDTVEASGFGIEGKFVTGPYVSFSGGITRKIYEQDLTVTGFSGLAGDDAARDSFRVDLEDMTKGFFNITANLDNYARLLLGYEKQEELANPIALAQGIYSETVRTRLDIYPARRLELGLGAAYKDYSDDNHGSVYHADAGYAFTDHPREVKGILSAEYRDTSDPYEACAGPGAQCAITDDFLHPYWTPQNYWKTALTVAFRHDLAEDFFCGAKAHFYELRLSVGTEKNQNHSVETQASWQREIGDRTGVEASAMWHNSSEWEAAALSLALFFRF